MIVFYLLFVGTLIGINIGLFLAETYWKKRLVDQNKNWEKIVDKTYYEAIEERDRAWEKKLNGTKLKPRLPSN